MTTINQLGAISEFSASDRLPVWQTKNSDTRSGTVGLLTDYVTEAMIPDGVLSVDTLNIEGVNITSTIRQVLASDREELLILAGTDAFSTGSNGAGISLYGNNDPQHPGNIALLTGPSGSGTARQIIRGNGLVYFGTNIYDYADTDQGVGLVNIKGNFTDGVIEGPTLFLDDGALSTGNADTSPADRILMNWTEESQDIGKGEGTALAFGVRLIGDTAPVVIARIASYKETSTDTDRKSAMVFYVSPDGISTPVEAMRIGSNGIMQAKSVIVSAPTADASIGNWDWENNAKAAAAMAKVLDGTGRMVIAEVGDSTTIGQTTAIAGAKTNSRPSQVAAMLAAAGIPTNVQSVFGTSNWDTEADIVSADPTISMGTGWVIGSSFTAGGNTFQCASPNTGIFAWTPSGTVDRFKLRYLTVSTAGILEYSLDGSTWTTINEGAASSLQTVTITATRGANTLRLRRNSGGTVYFCTLEAWDSLTPAVDILNMGWRGASSYNWALTTQPWYAPSVLANVAADLMIINLTINSGDLTDTGTDNSGNFETNFKARMQSLIDIGKATGDVWLVVGNNVNPAIYSNANQQLVRKYVYQLAKLNDATVIDLTTCLGRWSESYANGLISDWAHPTASGYKIAAQVEYAALRRLV